MPTFTQALTVEPGERTTANQAASLAAAFNSRLPHADCVWRIIYYFHSLVRSIRNPNEGFSAYPADAEWWNFWQHVEPEDGEWPQAGPGDPEGGNVANIMMGFVYGPENVEVGSELRRLASVPTSFAGITELQPRHIWSLGQLQRGAHDPATGATNSVAFDVARAYGYIRQGLYSPHGNSFGGYIAQPDTDWIFTNLSSGSTTTYAVSDYEIVYTPWAYYVLHTASGAWLILSKAEWLEGPYDGESYLRKTQANLLMRGMAHFASEFRGTEEQGAGTTNKHAFDLQKFLTTQYPLAPAYGAESGGVVQPWYPSWRATSSRSSGAQIGSDASWPEGTVCTGFIFVGSKLLSSCTVRLVEDGETIKTITIPVGDSDQIWWLPEATRLENLRVILGSDLELDTDGQLFVEATALMEYKPQLHDWYFVTRRSGYNGQLDRMDGRGIDFDRAKELGRALYDNGCVIPLVDQGDGLSSLFEPVFNRNAVYDACRRWVRGMARIIPRWNLTGYAVEGGKSVLWFNRTAYGPPGFTSRDMFEGIGPSQEAVTKVKWGRRYTVTAGSVTYGPTNQATTYHVGDELTGLQGIEAFTGGGTLMESDGIRATAEPRDWSNRWLMTLTLKPYSNSNSSLWKTDAFADINSPFWNRCHLRSPELQFSDEYKDHISYGEPLQYHIDAPSQMNFGRINDVGGFDYANEWDGSGDAGDPARFYKSCRVYEPALEIESAVMDGSELKVTLNGRFHSHEDAPSSLDRDPSTWDTSILDAGGAEDYRTHDNGIREYILWQATGRNAVYKVGDDALNSTLQTDPDAPLGCCLPTFMLVKMVPEPYLDGNDRRNEHDSYRTHDQLKQAEVYLRAICEGFVDGTTSAENSCAYSVVSAFDYSFENLMYQAAGNRWVPFDTTVRPDNPFTFGPGPNHRFYSQQFNALANGVNLLTDLRIMLPAELQSRGRSGSNSSSIPAVDACGNPSDCSSETAPWFVSAQGSLTASPTVTGAWGTFVDGQGANAGYNSSSQVSPVDRCVGSNWVIEADVSVLDLRWNLTDTDAVYALPLDYADLMESNAVAIMESTTVTQVSRLTNQASPPGPTAVESTGLCGSNYVWHETVVTSTEVYCGAVMTPVEAPAPGAGAITSARSDNTGLTGTVAGQGGASSTTVSVYTDGTSIVRCPTEPYSGGS